MMCENCEDKDDLFYSRWCLRGEPLSDSKDIKNKNQIVEVIPSEGEYKEYLQKLIDDNLS